MKIAIGIITYNESLQIVKYLQRFHTYFDGIVAVDTGSTDDTREILKDLNADVTKVPWKDFSDARNTCIARAESLGFDWMFVIDADESITHSAAAQLHDIAAFNLPVSLPRYEFVRDYYHIDSHYYPDFQVRFFPLNRDYHYKGVIHEVLFQDGDNGNLQELNKSVKFPFVHIYHYGRLKTPEEIYLHYLNMQRMTQGLERLPTCPGDFKLNHEVGPVIPFTAEQAICL